MSRYNNSIPKIISSDNTCQFHKSGIELYWSGNCYFENRFSILSHDSVKPVMRLIGKLDPQKHIEEIYIRWHWQ